MAYEAACVLEDGIATQAIDVMITLAYGFPRLPQRER